MDEKEIEELTIEEIDAHKVSCMEKNAWAICNNVKCRVDEEPGPVGDFLISMVTDTKENQFLWKRKYLIDYISAKAQKRQSSLPGYHYFKKIENFMNDHCDIGDLYKEFVAQKCIKTTGRICNSFMKLEKVEETGPVPRPMPDYSVSPKHTLHEPT